MTKIIGLTGGIGSGKTTVAKLFEQQGIPIYIADERAKLIMDREDIVACVQTVFEENVVVDGKLDRKKIRDLVFKDAALLEELNSIVHPAVGLDFEEWVAENASAPFVLKESAILLESNLQGMCDKVILVTAPLEVRVARVMERDKVTKESVIKIIENQMSDLEKEAFSDFIIKNIEIKDTEIQVLEIINQILT